MKKRLNSKVVLAIELVLIIFGLALSGFGAFKSVFMTSPADTEPNAMESMAAPGADPKQADPGDPELAKGGALNPAGAPMTGAADAEAPMATAPEGGVPMESAAEGETPMAGAPEGEAPMATAPEGEEPPAGGGMMPIELNMPQGVEDSISFTIVYIVPVVVFILLLVYVLVEYKKPHGNLLRETMLFYAFSLAIWSVAQGDNAGCVYVLPCTAVIVAYLSGRLNKIKKNTVWIAIAGAFLLGYGILQTAMLDTGSYGILQFSYCFGVLLQWITLALAYLSRYEEHVQAGQEAVPAE